MNRSLWYIPFPMIYIVYWGQSRPSKIIDGGGGGRGRHATPQSLILQKCVQHKAQTHMRHLHNYFHGITKIASDKNDHFARRFKNGEKCQKWHAQCFYTHGQSPHTST